MDTLRVWTKALAGSEVQTNMYAVTVEATAASLLMAFRFEDVVPFEFEELNPANTNEVLENGYKVEHHTPAGCSDCASLHCPPSHRPVPHQGL